MEDKIEALIYHSSSQAGSIGILGQSALILCVHRGDGVADSKQVRITETHFVEGLLDRGTWCGRSACHMFVVFVFSLSLQVCVCICILLHT